jgi:thiamine-phosphate pyrophosphorylase
MHHASRRSIFTTKRHRKGEGDVRHGVYAILDLDVLTAAKSDPFMFALGVIEHRPAALQVRAKNIPVRDVLALLEQLAPVCREAGVPLVNNDRVDIAMVGRRCDMVHLGQDDMPIEAARLLTDMGIGLSTHNPEQLVRALESRPTYVAYGPIFATGSKENHEPAVGLDGLQMARAIVRDSNAPHTPLVAIGGITAENAAKVIAHADLIAVIGALVGNNVGDRLHALQKAIGFKS